MDNVDNEGGEKSSRQLRKRVAAPHLVDESDGDDQDDESFYPEPNGSINGEDEDGESREQSTLKKKKATGKSKASKCKDGKPSRKRKGAEETLEQFKEPKKKFSHTTRRSRRCGELPFWNFSYCILKLTCHQMLDCFFLCSRQGFTSNT